MMMMLMMMKIECERRPIKQRQKESASRKLNLLPIISVTN